MRRPLVVALSALWLAAASAWAPFWHVHPENPDHHHEHRAGGFAHLHLAHGDAHELVHWGTQADDRDHDHGAELEETEASERTIWTDWAPTQKPRFEVAAVPIALAVLDAPVFVPIGVARQHTVRSHDPPQLRLLPPRSPPV